MQVPGELEAAWARSTREKIQMAAHAVGNGHSDRHGDSLERLVDAWPYLRPLYSNAVPGQAGLTEAQRRELQEILDVIGTYRGAGANSPHVRRVERWMAAKVADQIRRLAASLHTAPQSASRPVQILAPAMGAFRR